MALMDVHNLQPRFRPKRDVAQGTKEDSGTGITMTADRLL